MTNCASGFKLCLLLFCIFAGQGGFAQGWKWVNPVASAGIEQAYDVAVDSARGRVVVVGSWDGTDLSADLGGDFVSGGGSLDGLIACYDLAGNRIWSFSLESPGDDEVLAVDIDEEGSIYVSGYFTDNLNFQGDGGRSEILVNPSGENAFLAKYDTLGHLMWVINNGAMGDAAGLGVVADTAGVYTTGSYAGSLNFVSAATAPVFNLIAGLAAAPSGSMFAAHYDTSGTLIWLSDGGIFGFDTGRDVAIDEENVYVSGDFQSVFFDFYDGSRSGFPSASLTNSGGRDAFFVALDRNTGALKWIQQINCIDDDFGNAIEVDGRVLVHGTMGPSPLATLPNAFAPAVSGTRSLQDLYVAALDTANGNTQWGKIEAGNADDFAHSISIDGQGFFLVAGGFNSDVNFSGTVLNAAGQRDGYVAKYEVATGNLDYAKHPILLDHDQAFGIAAYNENISYIAGEFRGIAWFPPQLPAVYPNNDNFFVGMCIEGVVAINDSVCTIQETALLIDPLTNDFATFPSTVDINSILISPPNGVASIQNNDSILYTPNTGFTGQDSILYIACDSLNRCDTAWVFITVIAPPSAILTGLSAGYCPGDPASLVSPIPPGGVLSGPGISGSTFDPVASGPGVHPIEYTFTTVQGCIAADTQIVTVGDTIPTSIVNLDIFHCINDSPAVLTGSPAGGVFSGTGVVGGFFDPMNAGIGGPYKVKYVFTDTIGCSYADSLWLFVLPLPAVTLTAPGTQYCSSDPPVTLTGSPGGGIYSGPGTFSNSFDPSLAGPGTHEVVYGWADANGCTGYDTLTFTVTEPPAALTGLAPVYCIDGSPDTLFGAPAGGAFSGPGVNGNLFFPDSAGLGIHPVVYEVADTAGCVGRDTQFAEVFDLPTPVFVGLPTLTCVDAAPYTLNAQPAGGNYSGPGVSGNIFDPGQAGVGTHALIYVFTNANGCTGSDTAMVQVDASLNVTLTGWDSTYCGQDPAVTLTGSPAGGVLSGPGISGNQFDPPSAGPGIHTIKYWVSTSGCVDSVEVLIVVYGIPEVSLTQLDPEYCETSPEISLMPEPPGGFFTGPVTPSNGFDPASAGPGIHVITYTYTDTKGCSDSASSSTEVFPLPFPVNAGPDQQLFLGNSTQLAADPIVVGSGSWSVTQGGGSFADAGDPITTVTDLPEGTTVLTWTGVNGPCETSDDVNITLFDFPEERGVSPNDDGVNDVLILPGLKSFPDTKVRIYTRWGSLVWESDNYNDDWGGTNQSGEALPDDTYFYTIELTDGKQYKGFVFLKR